MPPTKNFHRWTTRDRQILCLLKLKYRRKFIVPIFNYALRTRLRNEGFVDGITATSLDAQYTEIKTGGKGHSIYAAMNTLSSQRLATEYSSHLKEIDSAIHSLKLKVEPRTRVMKRNYTPARPRQRQNLIKTRSPYRRRHQIINIDDTDSESEIISSSTTQRRETFAQQVSRFFPASDGNDDTVPLPENTTRQQYAIAPCLRIQTDINGNTVPKRPLLLFRATARINPLCARKFAADSDNIEQPNAFGSKKYKRLALSHLSKSTIFPSPFISFAQSARNSIGRIETVKSEDFNTKQYLVVYAFNDIEEDAKRNFGEGAGPHLASGLFAKGETSDLPRGYTGAGDWLVYGRVDCKPLITLDAPQVIDLAKALRRFSKGDIDALLVLQEDLKYVPTEWRESVAYAILRSYCAKRLPPAGTSAYVEMMSIVVDGAVQPFVELANFAQVSADEDDQEYEDVSSTNATRHRYIEDRQVPTQSERREPSAASLYHTNTVPLDSARSVVQTLSDLASKYSFNSSAHTRIDSTPFWSPEPPLVVNSARISTHLGVEQREAVTSATSGDIEEGISDDDCSGIDDDLGATFMDPFPSAVKRVKRLLRGSSSGYRTSTQSEASNDKVQEEEEDDCFVMLSIENNRQTVECASSNRGGFLRGLTAHAGSFSPPVFETPSRPPRLVAVAEAQRSVQVPATCGETEEQLIDRPRLENPFHNRTTTNETSIMRRLPPNVRTNGVFYLEPGTKIRTKMPVIVRKSLVEL